MGGGRVLELPPRPVGGTINHHLASSKNQKSFIINPSFGCWGSGASGEGLRVRGQGLEVDYEGFLTFGRMSNGG